MSRRPVQVGFAGVSAEWLDDELATLQRQQRMRVSAVFDPTPAVGALGAQRLGATHCRGFLQLLRSSSVDALVVANPGWMGWHTVLQAVRLGLPTLFVASRLDDEAFFDVQLPDTIRLETAVSYARGTGGGFLMPGLPLRWLPVTIRVRELTATALGAIEQLEVDAPGLALRSRSLAELVDWSLSIVQSAPASVQVHTTAAGMEMVLQCRRRRSNGESVSVVLRGLRQHRSGDVAEADVQFEAHGACRHGDFQLAAPFQIRHSIGRTAVDEKLNADRSSYDIMLDLFGRRLVGGLVPVPDFVDLLRARNLVVSAIQSLDHKEPIPVSEEGLGA
ncbi:MAG: hypothetical protein KDA90_04485 [Planctomycetaceae bacterium]|nr:hypothetical protein [Planctomycetaceae bacterium]